jgi:phasin family protein
MFNQFTELFQASLKPIDKLVELNRTTANTVVNQQGELIASLISGSISFGRNIAVPADVINFFAEQSKFSADVQSQLTESLKETSKVLIKAQKDAEVIINDSYSASQAKSSQVVFVTAPKAKAAPKAIAVAKNN